MVMMKSVWSQCKYIVFELDSDFEVSTVPREDQKAVGALLLLLLLLLLGAFCSDNTSLQPRRHDKYLFSRTLEAAAFSFSSLQVPYPNNALLLSSCVPLLHDDQTHHTHMESWYVRESSFCRCLKPQKFFRVIARSTVE
jgi:hypothetical protein